jgi:hypothetical protein
MMATLLAVYNSEGLIGRCDARCYHARWEDCTCICGGRNHGVGLVQAQNNIFDKYETILREAETLTGQHFERVDCRIKARQEALPI